MIRTEIPRDCRTTNAQLPALLLGDLDAADTAAMHLHLADCPACADALRTLQHADALLAEWAAIAGSAVVASRPVASWGEAPSPVGPLRVARSAEGVVEIGFAAVEELGAFLNRLTERGFTARHDQEAITGVAGELAAYFSGRRKTFDLPVDLRGHTAFTRAVLDACSRLPFGTVTTYGGIAATIGKPGAVRAVGGALGRNPVPIVVPCHRVLASGGKIGGYSGGLAIKRHLLGHEGVMLL